MLQIVQHAALGGATLMAMLLAEQLDPERYEMALATGPQTGSEGSLLGEMRAIGVPVHIIPDLVRSPHPVNDVRAVYELRDLFRTFKPHIVDTHGSKSKLLTPWAAALAPVPVKVAHISGWEWHPARTALQRRLYVQGSRLRVRDYDCLIAISKAVRQQGLDRGVGYPEQYEVIHSFADIKAFVPPTPEQRRAVREELRLPQDAFVAISVTRLSRQKSPTDLVAAAAKIVERLPNAHLVIVGDGPLRDDVVADIAARKLAKNVHMLLARRDVPRLLHAADVFVLSSRWEALGMVYLEAAATGLACVGTAVDGAVEAVDDGVTGIMTPPEKPELLAEAVLKLALNPQLRAKMGEAGIEKASHFSKENYVRAIDELYERLLVAKGIQPATREAAVPA
ncbi:MAG: glycosyltransferase family 4 protein [Armatimonadota bacterium]